MSSLLSVFSSFSSSSSPSLRTSFYAIDIGGIDDLDFHRTQLGDDGLNVLRIVDAFRQGLVEVVESHVALLLGELDQLADLFPEGAFCKSSVARRPPRPGADMRAFRLRSFGCGTIFW